VITAACGKLSAFPALPESYTMRIFALVTDAFGGHGGIALYVRNVLRALCQHPSEPQVVAIPRVIPGPLEPLPPNLTYVIEAKGTKVRFCAAAIKELVRRRDFDLVICTHIHLLSVAEVARKVTGAPLVLFVYGIDSWRPTEHPLSNLLVRRVDAIVSIRELTLERLKQWVSLHGVATYVLENAIQLDQYGVAPRNQALVTKYGLEGKRVLMTLGRVEEPRKGFDEVIQVLPGLSKEMPDIAYVVAGMGHDLGRLRSLAAKAGVADRVIFTGLIDDADKPDHYRLADVFAMPGSDPTFDRYPVRFVFLEAMACGLPVVASQPDGAYDLARTEGLPLYFVDPSDPESIKNGIRAAFAHGTPRVPPAISVYDYPAFARRLNGIVDEVLQGRHS
jgi:glycosyltransferase involved in cell wall biosynthesis